MVCKGKREKIVRDTKATYSNSDGSLMQRWAKYFKGTGRASERIQVAYFAAT